MSEFISSQIQSLRKLVEKATEPTIILHVPSPKALKAPGPDQWSDVELHGGSHSVNNFLGKTSDKVKSQQVKVVLQNPEDLDEDFAALMLKADGAPSTNAGYVTESGKHDALNATQLDGKPVDEKKPHADTSKTAGDILKLYQRRPRKP